MHLLCHLIGRRKLFYVLLQRESIGDRVAPGKLTRLEFYVQALAAIKFVRPHVVLDMSCFGRHMIYFAHEKMRR